MWRANWAAGDRLETAEYRDHSGIVASPYVSTSDLPPAQALEVSDFRALLYSDGYSWSGLGATNAPVFISYSFEEEALPFPPDEYSYTFLQSFNAFTTAERATTRQALQQWGDASGIVFLEVGAGAGDIRFGAYDLTYGPNSPNAIGFATVPLVFEERDTLSIIDGGGDVFVDRDLPSSLFLSVVLHEIGHAIGLKHPFDDDPTLPASLDHTSQTVMSYSGPAPIRLGPLDLQAVQHLYGPNSSDGQQHPGWSWNPATATLTLPGTGGDDFIRGGGTNDVIAAGAGDDTILSGWKGVDTIDGGADTDYLSLDRNSYATAFTFSLADPSVEQVLADGTRFVNIERVLFFGGTGNDNAIGGALTDYLYGFLGDDTLDGGDGDDELYGQEGADTLIGGIGDDRLFGGLGSDTLRGGDGDDYLDGAGGFNNTLEGGDGFDTYVVNSTSDIVLEDATSGGGQVLVNVNGYRAPAYVDKLVLADNGSYYGLAITAHAMGSVIHGSPGRDLMEGGDGDDHFFGNGGDDNLYGRGGNDVIALGPGDDRADGGPGTDLLLLTGSIHDYTVTPLGYALELWSPDGPKTVSHFELVSFDEGATSISFEAFLAHIPELMGTPTTGDDIIRGGPRGGELQLLAGNDIFHGGEGDERVFGQEGDDQISGGGGNDLIGGGHGFDTLAGGPGADRFVWFDASEFGDRVLDFSNFEGDRLLFGNEHASQPLELAGFDFVQGGTALEARGSMLFHGNTLYWDQDGTGPIAPVEVAEFSGLGTGHEARSGYNAAGWSNVATGDFNNDGIADLLWKQDGSGATAAWLMGSGGTPASTPFYHGLSGWELAAAGDFGGDGADDLMWTDASGNTAIWMLSGGQTVANYFTYSTRGWSSIGAGDFNGDGLTDPLWLETGTGMAASWLMSGGQPAATRMYLPTGGWELAAIGDFNGNGIDDILWRQGGQVAAWMMGLDGALASGNPAVGYAGEAAFIGVGDFNADGAEDLLWRAPNGQTGAWLMSGGAIAAVPSYFSTDGWALEAISDLNHDGADDLVWRNEASGQTALWLMQPGTGHVGQGVTYDPVGGAAVIATGDFNGDGTDDLIWGDASGNTDVWTFSHITENDIYIA